VRVVIVEDLALLRAKGSCGCSRTRDTTWIAAVEDGSGLLRVAVTERPDVAVVDVRLPPSFRDEGLRAAIEARRRVPGLPVLVLSQYVEQTYASELLAGGVGGVGYLLKERVADTRDFVAAVERVAEGGTALDPEVVRQLVARRGQLSELTPREREVLGLMAEGRSNAAIAAELVISESAVEKHVSRIFEKLGLPPSDSDHRRVLAVLAYLRAEG
jgi:DNA-binding NarL/FixJ family response regulator